MVHSVLQLLIPALNGGEGFVGLVSYPGFERISTVLGDVRAAAYTLFINTF